MKSSSSSEIKIYRKRKLRQWESEFYSLQNKLNDKFLYLKMKMKRDNSKTKWISWIALPFINRLNYCQNYSN